jgi:hypothetical protein
VEKEMKEFRGFEDAREFVRSLGLKNDNDWREYCKSGTRPNDIPANPNTAYKNKGYLNLGDWLGTGNIRLGDMVYSPFKEAREFVKSLKLKNYVEWKKYCKSNNLPNSIPRAPDQLYKNKGWTDWGDFLGTENVHTKQFRPFKEAKEFAQSLGLNGAKVWFEYCKSGNKPGDIPRNPQRDYKNKGWTDWGDFLGTGTISSHKTEFRPFKEAKEFAQKLKLKNAREWAEYAKSGSKPDDIPSAPWDVYKEWKKK